MSALGHKQTCVAHSIQIEFYLLLDRSDPQVIWYLASAHEAYLHGQLAEHARGRERHRLSGRQRSDETDRRVGPQRGDQAITFGFDGVVGDARQRAEVDAPATALNQCFGVDAT